jgi:hypothetical protein
MDDRRKGGTATLVEEGLSESGHDERVAHLVLKPDWPIALCGANVREHLGTGAPAMDRCPDCLRIAAARGLGRPGWTSR